MPGVNGIEVVKDIFRELKKRNKQNPPVIFITGYADEKCEQEAKTLNPIAYIYKPFDISDLMGRVKEVLSL
jgi:response regulator RpfG family c-di-GMP phosphodiesterase